MEEILYIGIAQTLFSGIIIALKKPRTIANQILAAWLLIICAEMIIMLINETWFELYTIKILPYTYGPMLLLYAKWITTENPKFNLRYLWHFAPFFIFLIASLVYIDERVMDGTHGYLVIDRFVSFRIVYGITFFISITAYSVTTFVVIHRHQKRLKQLVSFSSEKITLKWLLGLSITFYTGYVIMFIFGGIDILVGFMPFNPYKLSFISLTLLTFLFGVFGFHQPSIFEEVVWYKGHEELLDLDADSNLNLEPDIEVDPKKYQKSGLRQEDVADLVNKIRKYMVIKKPFLDRELSIYDLSDQLRISRHTLSEVINEHMGMNFYNLVNEYRVKEVKERMKSDKYRQLTILAIAYDSGFNSKSSFNTIFKEKTGQTPSEYLAAFNAKNS
jgi:AraC-like DNA-binding protein